MHLLSDASGGLFYHFITQTNDYIGPGTHATHLSTITSLVTNSVCAYERPWILAFNAMTFKYMIKITMVDETKGSLVYIENQSLDHGWDLRRSIFQSNKSAHIDKDKRV